MSQVKLGEFHRNAAAEAANAITNIGDWKNTKEGEQHWKSCVASLRAMSMNGTSDGQLPIPEGYRDAKTDEYWRHDVLYYDTISTQWHGRGPQTWNAPFSPSIRYGVPVDVIPTDADCENGRPVVMTQERGDTWLPAKLLTVLDHVYPYIVLIGNTYSTRLKCRYPYAGELERIVVANAIGCNHANLFD